MTRQAGCLLLFSLLSASTFAEEFEFQDSPPDMMFAPGEFTMPLPPPAAGMAFGMAGMHAMPGMPFNLIMLAEHLELTREQREKAGKILDETTPKLRELMFRMIDARKAGRELKSGDAGDKELRRHADEQGEIVADLTYLGLKARSDLRALLTEEQRMKLDSMTEGRGSIFLHRLGPMGGIDPARLPVTRSGGKSLAI